MNSNLSNQLLKILLYVVIALLAIHFSLQALNWLVYHQQAGAAYELANRFDLDDEASVPTWFSQFLFLLIGVSALLAVYLEKDRYLKRFWKVVGVAGLIFSVDEIAGLHEFILQIIHNLFFRDQTPSDSQNAWLIVLPFILVTAVYLVYKTARLLPNRTTFLFAVAIATFLVGATAVDLLTSLTERESFLHQGILVGLEEALELISGIIFLYAISEYLESKHKSVFQGLLLQLKNGDQSHNRTKK